MSIFDKGNFSQIGGVTKYRKYENYDAGDQVAGELVQVRPDQFGKPSYIIRVQEVSFKKTSDQPSIGELFTLNSSGGLAYKIEQAGGISVGDVIGIEYNGKVTVEKGKWKGKSTHDIDLFVAKSGKRSAEVEEMISNTDSELDLI